MDVIKQKKLSEFGFTVGGAQDFLELTPEELVTIESQRSQREEVPDVPRSTT